MTFDNSFYQYYAGYYQVIEGKVWLPGKLIPNGTMTFSQKAVDAAMNANLDDSDVLLSTYPKTGTTWTMAILRQIRNEKYLQEGKEISTDAYYDSDTMPFMEEAEWANGDLGADKLERLEPPRFMKTHLSHQLWKEQLEEHLNLRVIQVLRNPKDTLVSYYHHMRSENQLGAFNGSWDQFYEVFKQNKLPWGDYFEHVADWFRFNRFRDKSLVLVYEEMVKDPKAHVIKIANFINTELPDTAVDLVVKNTSFKEMSGSFNDKMKGILSWNSERSTFLRKGKVGDWVNYFSKKQSEYVDAKCSEFLEPLGLKL